MIDPRKVLTLEKELLDAGVPVDSVRVIDGHISVVTTGPMSPDAETALADKVAAFDYTPKQFLDETTALSNVAKLTADERTALLDKVLAQYLMVTG